MALPFSPAVTRNGFVFLSGQVHVTDGKLLDGSIQEQTHLIMKNLQSVLEKEGLSFRDVVKTTIYTTDMSLYGQVNEVYGSYFPENPPAREMIGVRELPLGARLEISMIASKE
jgi:2-iminobutanoate/2-iminopropanoate deaminase